MKIRDKVMVRDPFITEEWMVLPATIVDISEAALVERSFYKNNDNSVLFLLEFPCGELKWFDITALKTI